MHPSRWGHWAAGRWLIEHAEPDDGGPRHPGLGRVRPGRAGLRHLARPPGARRPEPRLRRRRRRRADGQEPSGPRRSRSLLAYAGSPVAEFPEREGGRASASASIGSTGPTRGEGMRPMSRGDLPRPADPRHPMAWLSDRHRGALPPDLAETVMDLDSADRHHAKQGRTTARVRFDGAVRRRSRSTSSGTTACPGRPGSRPCSARRGHTPGVERVAPPRAGPVARHPRCPRSSRRARRSAPGDGSAAS